MCRWCWPERSRRLLSRAAAACTSSSALTACFTVGNLTTSPVSAQPIALCILSEKQFVPLSPSMAALCMPFPSQIHQEPTVVQCCNMQKGGHSFMTLRDFSMRDFSISVPGLTTSVGAPLGHEGITVAVLAVTWCPCADRLRSHETCAPVKGGKWMQSAYLLLPSGAPTLPLHFAALCHRVGPVADHLQRVEPCKHFMSTFRHANSSSRLNVAQGFRVRASPGQWSPVSSRHCGTRASL